MEKQSKDKKLKRSADTQDKNEAVHDLSSLRTSQLQWKSRKLRKHITSRKMHEEGTSYRRYDKFPGDAPVPSEKIEKYKRGDAVDMSKMTTKIHAEKFEKKEEKLKMAAKMAARTELLQTEESGFLEVDDDDLETNDISQYEIAENVDITSAQKFFQLNLKFGPYRMDYTRNGRNLLIGGRKGHVAAFDWQTKKLLCEMNVMETVHDVKWLHIETMFAVAQKQCTYVYDNQGIELHCLRTMDQPLRLEFLPYHFLLVSSSANGNLSYLDVSVGQRIARIPVHHGRLDVMCQNPHNAIIHLGHTSGTVTLWSPNTTGSLAKMLCHRGGVRSVAVDHTGQYMATSGVDRKIKIWDIRMYQELKSYQVAAGPSQMTFSQRGLLAAGMGNVVEVFEDCARQTVDRAYITHQLSTSVQGLQFCPYEDVLGVGHGRGFASLLVPGAGEANFDALEANPYQTKKQRQQAEVKMLLEKIQPDMITIDTAALGKVDKKSVEDAMEEKKKRMFFNAEKADFTPKYKKKGRSKSGKIEKRKQGVQYEHKQQQVKAARRQKVQDEMKVQKSRRHESTEVESPEEPETAPYNIFGRFK